MCARKLAIFLLASLACGQQLDEGKRAFNRGDYASAARLFEQAHKASPSCEILFFIGLARYRLKQIEPALIAFRSATECDPQLVPAHLALAEAYTEKHNDTEALAAYNRILAMQPKNAAALSGAAGIYLKGKSNPRTAELLEALVTVAPGDADAHADLGAAYAAAGDRQQAADQFQIALKIKPSHASALMGLGNLSLKNGEEERAIELLQKAVQSAPNAFEPRYLLGTAYNRLGRFQDALAQLQGAVRRNANEAEVYYHLARAYGGLGRQDERSQALARFAQLTKKGKEDAEAQRRAVSLIDEAEALVEQGNLRLALARMEEARELRPADDRLLFRLASVYYDLRQYDFAQAYAQEASSLAPSEWLYHYLSGLIATRRGKWPQARVHLETAARLNSSAAEIHNALGEVAQHEGDLRGAVAAFQRAVELKPEEPAYRLNLEAARKQ